MFSKRIQTLASLIDKNSVVLDVGTDHAYLPIYLYQKKITNKVYGSDISNKVIIGAENNLLKYNLNGKIKLFVSDGLENIKINYDTLVIAGMGYMSIKKILSYTKLPKTIVIQSNSDHYLLRKFMNKLGFSIDKEITIEEKNIYYVIIKYIKKKEFLSYKYLLFGKSFNNNYYLHLKDKYNFLLKKVPLRKKIKFNIYIYLLNKLLKENRV